MSEQMTTPSPAVPPTLGQLRVRAFFNPSQDQRVNDIKQQSAQLIDWCKDMQEKDNPEKSRCAALAMTAYEEAAMWAVKAATG